MTKFDRFCLWFALFFMALCMARNFTGCTDLQSTEDTVTRLQGDVASLKARASTMPADSPDKKVIEANADKADKALSVAKSALEAARTGDPSGLAPIAATIPYGTLGLALLTLSWREYKLRQTRAALTQTTIGIENAFPAGKPPEVKAALADAQDASTKAKVEAIKAGVN